MSEYYNSNHGDASKEFPCVNRFTEVEPCGNFVFYNQTACVNCRDAGKFGTEDQVELSEIADELVDYLVEAVMDRMRVETEELSNYHAAGKARGVKNILAVAVDSIHRNYIDLYDQVADELEATYMRARRTWTAEDLVERLERIQEEQEGEEEMTELEQSQHQDEDEDDEAEWEDEV
ncbi:Fc.00g050960.m01.CDS01 [Cosmosporella sp. VM-42]